MTLIKALDQSIELGLTNSEVFESRLTGKFLNSIGKSVGSEKEYLCLIDMEKRKITILGESPK